MILQEYLNYTKDSESPESYHIWVFLSMVAAIIGKRAWIKFNYFNVFPNMYVILVSLPGVGKKSTAMRIGRQMVEEAETTAKITFDSITREALIGELETCMTVFETPTGGRYGSSPLTAIASELVILLSGGGPMVEFLTDVYDSDKQWRYKTKNCGENIIQNPCLNIISGVTTDNFCSRIIKDAVASGFISRSVIIYDNEVKVESPFKMPTQPQLDSRQRVIARFTEISDLYGEVTFTPEAKKMFEEWYTTEFNELHRRATNMEFQSRKHIHVVKCAMLLAVSELSLVITEDYLGAAIELLRRVESNMKFVYMSAGANQHAELYLRILSAIKSVEFVEYHELLQFFMKDVDEEDFIKIITTMESAKYIQQTSSISEKGKPIRKIQITQTGRKLFDRYDGGM
jgi:hypothetical protein